MDNLMDVYYLTQLLVHQIFVYARDFILHEFSWFDKPDEEIEVVEARIREAASTKQFLTDFVTIFIVCCLLVILVILSNSRGKEENDYSMANIDTSSISIEDDDPFCFSESTTSMITNCLHACGDSIYPRNIFSRKHSPKNALKRLPHSLPNSESHSNCSQHTQSTQTSSEILLHEKKNNWLVRRTRSGQIYGKYRM